MKYIGSASAVFFYPRCCFPDAMQAGLPSRPRQPLLRKKIRKKKKPPPCKPPAWEIRLISDCRLWRLPETQFI